MTQRNFEIEFNLQATTFRDHKEIPTWTVCDDLVPMFLHYKDRFGPDFTVEERCEVAIFSHDKKLQLRSDVRNSFCSVETGKKAWSWSSYSSLYGFLEAKDFSKQGKFLHFHDLQSSGEFSLDQLEFLAKTIQSILEEELGFEIIPPVIYFRTRVVDA